MEDKLNNTPDTAKLPAPIAPIALQHGVVVIGIPALHGTTGQLAQLAKGRQHSRQQSTRLFKRAHTCGTCAARFVLAHRTIIGHWAHCPVYPECVHASPEQISTFPPMMEGSADSKKRAPTGKACAYGTGACAK